MKQVWQERSAEMKQLVKQYNKAILFTEWGYENEDYVGAEPWIMGRYKNASNASNEEAHSLAYQSFFETVWEEPWMKGVFVWRWSPSEKTSNKPNYSPRGKLAEKEMVKWFQ